MKSIFLSSSYVLLYCFSLFFILQSCSTRKETTEHAGMQNLTAKFNILYNSRILLEEIETNLEASHIDDFNQILSVYAEPDAHSSASQITLLDSVIKKANKIIEEKSASNYVDDAYLLIATAQYLKANFFEAAEFYSYINRTYAEDLHLRQAALIMKARAEMQLGNMAEARNSLDSAFGYPLNNKKSAADLFATRAQLLISANQELEAIKELEKALAAGSTKRNKTRWKYVLGQLQLQNDQLDKAFENFKAVGGSNASYEMAFNANVNRLLIEDKLKGGKSNFIFRLKNLLNDDKNLNYSDQVYYRIGELYRSREQLKDASDSYNMAIRVSTSNQSIKGLAYLRLADLHFNAAKYSTSKLYLDSALNTLPPSFPGYEKVRKKSANLDLLASLLQTIAREERLQALAKLPESERNGLELPSDIEEATSVINTNQDNYPLTNASRDGKFYFNNTAALSQGLSDFKNIWGNRRLEDHWRRSEKSSVNDINLTDNYNAPEPSQEIYANSTNLDRKQDSNTKLPLTIDDLEQSNKRIITAMYDIGVFYKDELNDAEQAIITFENLLSRYPNNSNASTIHYHLYRLYQLSNPEKADYYKNIILSRYPESNFAKVILDPQYIDKIDDKERALNEIYNETYNLYVQKNYSSVIQRTTEAELKFGNNHLSPQLAYLKALSIGRTQKLPALEEALNSIIKLYPGDQIVSPLVNQHLEYIDLNRPEFLNRLVALPEHSKSEEEFKDHSEVQEKPAGKLPALVKAERQENAPVNLPVSIGRPEPSPKTEVKESLFSLPDSAEYYFVVNVSSPVVNLSSSRFGIGQFNRTNFQGQPIKHQVINVNDENQLILVGSFNNKTSVTDYARRISPLLKEIMKIPVEKYNTFVISKEGLNKLKDSTLINSYLDFYKNSQ